jgi:hypothetical protein
MRSTARNIASADRWAALVGASFVTAGDAEGAAPAALPPDALDVATDMAARAALRVDRHPQLARWSGPRAVPETSPAAALDLVR